MAEPAGYEIDVDRAIAEAKLVLRYQPIVATTTGKLVGLEALLRWNDRDGPEIPPREIVAAAEASGRIRALTFWVLREALLQSSVWKADGVPTTVGVNLSVHNLRDPQFQRHIDLALKVAGAPELLVAEVGSASLEEDPEPPLAALELMRERGIRVALDDVGAGGGTPRDLSAFPADIVKVGRAIVSRLARDDEAVAIARAIVAGAHERGRRTTAVGVEDDATMRRVAMLEFDSVQGYAIGRPMSATELAAWRKTR